MTKAKAAPARTELRKDSEAPVKGTRIFESEYGKLNEQQKKAVDTIEGPVMVVAGPGTGKTQTVALRVANILRKTHMRPGNILCLTFSVSGSVAMRERLRLLIGADAYGVKVQTIHAFAQSIIEDNAFLFDEWSARQQISDLEKVREMNTIIDQSFTQSELIHPKDPYGRVPDLLSRISEVKREGKTYDDLVRVSKEYDVEMAGKSKPTTKQHEKNLLAARKFKEFAEMFRAYQEMLERTGRYDYDDMILNVVRALREEDWLLANLQERYQYVLVDEFQDTNGSQYELIRLLTTYETVAHEPNLFVVGDDDQAIYRFQGANLKNMLSFHERFPKAPVIALTVSYRSTQSILDAARSLIERNEERLVGNIPGLQKLLSAASGVKGDTPELLRPASDIAEPWMIADVVEERIAAGVHPEQIAILTQQNNELFPIYDVLRAREIPALLRGKDDLLTHPLVLQSLAILDAVEQPRSDAKLMSALACDCFRVHPSDLGRIAAMAREKKARIEDILALPNDDLQLHDREALVAAWDAIQSLHAKIASRTALETVEHVLRDCGLIPSVEQGAESTIDPRDLGALESFFAYVKKTCMERRHCTLRDVLSDLRFYTDPTYGQVRLTYELPHLTASGVRLMTAHQSKGLEFDTVILANFRDGHWDKRIRRTSVAVPEELLFGWEKEQKSFEKNQDERRVAFVAITRAKKKLILSCPKELTVGEKSRTISPSGFFAEMGTLPESDAALKDAQGSSLLFKPKPTLIDGALKAYLEERLKTFALSPTSLRRFLRDPKEFLLVDLLQQPEHFDESSVRSLGYGSAVHWALRQWATARKDGKENDLPRFLEAFEWYLRERTILTEKQRESLLALGNEALPKYYEQRLQNATPFLHAIEQEYRSHLGEIPIKGKIDRIDRLNETSALATVIDYKAGKGKTETEVRGGFDPGVISKTDDGSHFRQLAFYALLLEKADPLLKPEAFALEYIGERGESPVTRTFSVTDDEKAALQKLVKDVWKKISEFDFSPL